MYGVSCMEEALFSGDSFAASRIRERNARQQQALDEYYNSLALPVAANETKSTDVAMITGKEQ